MRRLMSSWDLIEHYTTTSERGSAVAAHYCVEPEQRQVCIRSSGTALPRRLAA